MIKFTINRSLLLACHLILCLILLPSCSDNQTKRDELIKEDAIEFNNKTLHIKFDYYLSILFMKYNIIEDKNKLAISDFASKNMGSMALFKGISLDSGQDSEVKAENRNDLYEKEAKKLSNYHSILAISDDDIQRLTTETGIPKTTLGSLLFDWRYY